jgi:hypothetical protein
MFEVQIHLASALFAGDGKRKDQEHPLVAGRFDTSNKQPATATLLTVML